jgi:ABC-2 type transport system ATP-binding protein
MALDLISFDVRTAEIFGLLGPNGSGKTTLFRILSTLMVPGSGRARVADFDPVTQPNEVRRRIGVVAQAQSVDVKLTAAENLMHQGHLYGLSGARLKRRISEMLERVGLSDRANDLVETLSGGMQRRVELAKGLMHRPSVLLLDEPTTGLDPGARRDLWIYLDSLREHEGVTVLVTTHLMEEAERCNRLAILSHGKLVGLGTPAELKSEIGGDVIQFESEHPAALAERILQRFGIVSSVDENVVRLERPQGHRFAADVMEAFPGEIQSVNISRPTLEDVFVNRTGHRFWTEDQRRAE